MRSLIKKLKLNTLKTAVTFKSCWNYLFFDIPKSWRTDILAPPLRIGVKTKELITKHYLEGMYANGIKPVAWVTSGAPVEFLKALGFYTLYPENHGALCGARKVALELCQEAEKNGYCIDICSYARTDIGSALSGKTPVGRLPKPDLLVCCTNICQTVLYWYQVLAHHFKAPLVIIDTPFIYTEASLPDVEYVQKQIETAIETAERIAKRKLKFEKLKEVMRLSKIATELWLEVINTGKNIPSPISAFDQFIHMAPIVELRGEPQTVDFYAQMLKELRKRVKKGIGAVIKEKKRVLWDNLPIWYSLKLLSETLAENGICVVTSTYTYAWGELAPMIDPERPIESMAKVYLHPILNRGTGDKLSLMKRMVKDFRLNGVILHSDRSCKPYSVGQMDQRAKIVQELKIPAVLIESDHNDPRAFSEKQVLNRLKAFMEM